MPSMMGSGLRIVISPPFSTAERSCIRACRDSAPSISLLRSSFKKAILRTLGQIFLISIAASTV